MAANPAKICTGIRSSWIQLAILMCNDTLSVQFHNGFCCNYLRSTRAHYQQIIAAHSAGHWLRKNLYRILPYKVIALPCPPAGCGQQTACCPNVLPNTLHATANLGIGSVPLVYDGALFWASQAAVASSCGAHFLFRLHCQLPANDCNSLQLEYTCDGGTNWIQAAVSIAGCTCSPLSLPYTGQAGPFQNCQPCNDILNVTVTT